MILKSMWILSPILVYILFQNEKYAKARKYLLISCLSYFIVFLFPVLLGFGYKYDIFTSIAFTSVYISIFIAFFFILKKIEGTRKWLRICSKVFFIYPVASVFAVVTALILFARTGEDQSQPTFHRGEYTIKREVEWFDNLKEFAAITIYKDSKYIPFLYYKVYEEKDYNTYLQGVRYDKENKTMTLDLSRGSDMWKEEWQRAVSLD